MRGADSILHGEGVDPHPREDVYKCPECGVGTLIRNRRRPTFLSVFLTVDETPSPGWVCTRCRTPMLADPPAGAPHGTRRSW